MRMMKYPNVKNEINTTQSQHDVSPVYGFFKCQEKSERERESVCVCECECVWCVCVYVCVCVCVCVCVTNLGVDMARFTQFPLMITQWAIIYEIISPGAAGSSIYV